MRKEYKMRKGLFVFLATAYIMCSAGVICALTITSNQTGTNNGYYYSFWNNGASGSCSMTLGAGSNYSVTWSNVGDFTCGKGWNPGSGHTITYSGSYSNSGGGACGIYGWTTNPLVEYYIADSWNGVGQGTNMGTVTSDGGTYTIWKHQQVNQPSIQGTATFWQYISVRQSQRVGGTITIQNHFNAWASLGMNLGTHNYQVLLTEGWSGSGSANITVSEGASQTSPPAATPTNPPAATATPAPGTTAAPTNPPSGGASGCTCAGGCSSQTSISSTFTKDGAGEFCFVASSLGSYVNSWNMVSVTINGADYTNKWANVSSLPKNSDGKYYIYYKGSYAWSHFEAK
jgi:endo-1,4-beta-xylanase